MLDCSVLRRSQVRSVGLRYIDVRSGRRAARGDRRGSRARGRGFEDVMRRVSELRGISLVSKK